MNQWPLTWISQESLTSIVRKLFEEGSPKSKGLAYSNLVDPFSALFDMALSDYNYDQWIKAEIRRQHQKTLQNAIGKFHQCVLGSVDGWEDHGVGDVVDLVCPQRKIFAEIKNKFNTVKASDKINLYDTLATWRGAFSEHHDYTGYYVQILAKGRFDRPFAPSDNKKKTKPSPNKFIREIDGQSFYTLVTGSETALEDLYKVLPSVIKAVRADFDDKGTMKDPHFQALFDKAFTV